MTQDDRPGPDTTAAELRLIRAEITAIRRQVIREQETRERPAAQCRYIPSPAAPPVPVTLRARLAAWLAGEDARRRNEGPQ
jgi:hypothetical protein